MVGVVSWSRLATSGGPAVFGPGTSLPGVARQDTLWIFGGDANMWSTTGSQWQASSAGVTRPEAGLSGASLSSVSHAVLSPQRSHSAHALSLARLRRSVPPYCCLVAPTQLVWATLYCGDLIHAQTLGGLSPRAGMQPQLHDRITALQSATRSCTCSVVRATPGSNWVICICSTQALSNGRRHL